jgi:hypothetical protein
VRTADKVEAKALPAHIYSSFIHSVVISVQIGESAFFYGSTRVREHISAASQGVILLEFPELRPLDEPKSGSIQAFREAVKTTGFVDMYF